jgi:hypothetical protein
MQCSPLLAHGLALGLVASVVPAASAGIGDFVSQVEPAYRGAPAARYDGYDVFTQAAFLPNFADLPGSCAGTDLVQLDPAAILTSSGNIYSFATVTAYVVTLPADDVLLEVSVQTRSLANVLDSGSFLLVGSDGFGHPQALSPSAVIALSGDPGEFQCVWDAAALAGLDLSAAHLEFAASGASCSTDVVLVDYRTARPPLEADVEAISVSLGGTQHLDLDAGTDRAGAPYLVLGSASGTAPGIPLDNVVLPLGFDAYTTLTLTSANNGPFQGTFGLLDACGRATAQIVVPAGTDGTLAGLALDHAFLTLDLSSFTVGFASNAAGLSLGS